MQKARAEVRGSDHGRDARATAGRLCLGQCLGPTKKECLFLTNEAVRLLKTKDRQNERSRTKPILAIRIWVEIGGGRLEGRSSESIRYARRAVTQFTDVAAGLSRQAKHGGVKPPLHQTYDDQVKFWVDGQYLPLYSYPSPG